MGTEWVHKMWRGRKELAEDDLVGGRYEFGVDTLFSAKPKPYFCTGYDPRS